MPSGYTEETPLFTRFSFLQAQSLESSECTRMKILEEEKVHPSQDTHKKESFSSPNLT